MSASQAPLIYVNDVIDKLRDKCRPWRAPAAMFRRMLPSFRLTAAFALSSLGASSLGIRASEAPTKSFVHDTLSTAEPIRPPLKATEQPTTKVKLFGGHLNAELAEQIGI